MLALATAAPQGVENIFTSLHPHYLNSLQVTLFDHSSCTARVVGWDASKDIAVLKLALPRGRLEALQPVLLGSSASLRVGQACFAIGNPFGLDHTLTQVR
jgi:S1-C subfamily serine protease